MTERKTGIRIIGAKTAGLEELNNAVLNDDNLNWFEDDDHKGGVLAPFSDHAIDALEAVAFTLGVDNTFVQPAVLSDENTSSIDAHVIDRYNEKFGTNDQQFSIKAINDLFSVLPEPEPKVVVEQETTVAPETAVVPETPTELEPVYETPVESETMSDTTVSDDEFEKAFNADESETVVETADVTPDMDEWHEKAVALFNQAGVARLPKFDAVTHQFLQPEILKAHDNLSESQARTIDAIANKLSSVSDKAFGVVNDNNGLEALEKHNATIQTIKDTEALEVQNAHEAIDADYEQKREEYVQSRLDDIRKEYDTIHGQAHADEKLEAERKVAEQVQANLDAENQKYDTYMADITSYVDKQVNAVDVAPFIQAYNEDVATESQVLKDTASDFANVQSREVETLASDLDATKKQLENAQRELEISKATSRNVIDAEVAKVTSELALTKNKELSDMQQELERTRTELRDEQLKSATLSHSLQVAQMYNAPAPQPVVQPTTQRVQPVKK